jgi:hypothetical protein
MPSKPTHSQKRRPIRQRTSGTKNRAATVRVAQYPQLKDLCWSAAVTELPARYAFAIYERNWRFIDRQRLVPRERLLLETLTRRFGAGVING